jgi:hypothetical protein
MVCTIYSNPYEYTGLCGLWRQNSTKAARGLIKYSVFRTSAIVTRQRGE